jgi:cystathionine beta-lyase
MTDIMVTAHYDDLTVEDLSGVLGVKWNKFPDCIGAFVAEMDCRTAPPVIDALQDLVAQGFFGYLPEQRSAELSAAVSKWYADTASWVVPAERIYPLPDVIKGLEVTLSDFAPKGGKVIVPTPAYMPFLFVPEFHGREIVQVPMHNDEGYYTYDLDAIDRAFADGGEVLIVCNPHNPVGRVLTRGEMVAISEVVERHGGRVFSDEIHAPLVFEGHTHVPYASVSEAAANHTVTAIAASKAWNLAGLKCAQIVMSNERDDASWKDGAWWAGHGASSLGVVASTVAWSEGQPWLDDILAYLDGNRKLMANLIAEHLPGVRYTPPEGTYLGWLDFRETPLDGDLAEFFRERAKVAVVDGGACGEVASRFVRFNIAMPQPLLERSIRQMAEALQRV